MTYKPTQQTLDIVKRLGGTWHGNHGMCRCPAHDDSTPSLSIKQGKTTILVHCFARCTGEEIMSAIRQKLGRSVLPQLAETAPATKAHNAHLRIWDGASPVPGTLAERYLADVRRINFIPPDVRFHPRCPKGKGADAQFLPALLVGIYRLETLCAIQRLFLDPLTGRRTDRMILGDSHCGIWPRLHTSPHIRIAEGFETACAFQQITGLPASTCFGDRNFAIAIVPKHATRLTFLPDNDEEGMFMANAAIATRNNADLITDLHQCPPRFNDWAQILNGNSHLLPS